MSGHHALAFYPTPIMTGDAATTPFLSRFDHQLFPYNLEEDVDVFAFLEKDFITNTLVINQATEIYKILSIV